MTTETKRTTADELDAILKDYASQPARYFFGYCYDGHDDDERLYSEGRPDAWECDCEDWHINEDGTDERPEPLDIKVIAGLDGKIYGFEILISFGVPNVWIDTRANEVKGSWGWTSRSAPLSFGVGELILDHYTDMAYGVRLEG